MDEIANIGIVLARLLKLSDERMITLNDITETCDNFEISEFKDDVESISQKLTNINYIGSVSYDFSEPDVV